MPALTTFRNASTLEEDWERLLLDVWLVPMAEIATFRALSMLDDELERLVLDA
jgi:hypothetical protein